MSIGRREACWDVHLALSAVFSVADLAMRSGHFLAAAVDEIEALMRIFLTEHSVPGVTEELNGSPQWHAMRSAHLRSRLVAARQE